MTKRPVYAHKRRPEESDLEEEERKKQKPRGRGVFQTSLKSNLTSLKKPNNEEKAQERGVGGRAPNGKNRIETLGNVVFGADV